MPALMIREDLPPDELRRLAKAERDLRVARRLLAFGCNAVLVADPAVSGEDVRAAHGGGAPLFAGRTARA